MNAQETATILTVLTSTYPNHRITEPAMTEAIWQGVFASVPFAEVNAAAQRWIISEEWFPKPSQLLALIEKQAFADERRRREGPGAYAALEQVQYRLGFRAAHGRWPMLLSLEGADRDGDPLWNYLPLHPLIERTVSILGGWDQLPDRLDSFQRAEFQKAYREFQEEAAAAALEERAAMALHGEMPALAGGMP